MSRCVSPSAQPSYAGESQEQALRQFAAGIDSFALRRDGGKWRVAVTAQTSPEGSLSVNRRLAHCRAMAVCVDGSNATLSVLKTR